MRTFLLVVAVIGLIGCLLSACAHQEYGQTGAKAPAVQAPPTPERAPVSTGAVPSGPEGPVRFGSGVGPEQMGTQTGSGLEGSSQYTPFGGSVGGFPRQTAPGPVTGTPPVGPTGPVGPVPR